MILDVEEKPVVRVTIRPAEIVRADSQAAIPTAEVWLGKRLVQRSRQQRSKD
jgi:hypothetical protein